MKSAQFSTTGDAPADAASGCVQGFIALLQSYTEDDSSLVRSERHLVVHAGYVLTFDRKRLIALAKKLNRRYPTIAQSTIEKRCDAALQRALATLPQPDNAEYAPIFEAAGNAGTVEHAAVESATVELLDDLVKHVQPHTVYIPLSGVNLQQPQMQLGAATLVRTEGSAFLQEIESGRTFVPLHAEFVKLYRSHPAYIQLDVTGDTEYARLEGLHAAEVLAKILNLHLASCQDRNHLRQKIQVGGASSAYVGAILARVEFSGPTGEPIPTYLPAVSKRAFIEHNLDVTELRRIETTSFERLYGILAGEPPKPSTIEYRLRQAVRWYVNAVNFDAPDEQMIALATALETLLVAEDAKNPRSNWASISQQIAERCAYLLGHDWQHRSEIAQEIKRLYGVRSRAVHGGGMPLWEDVSKLSDLTQRTIIDFLSRGFATWDQFESWFKRLKYSVNIWDVRRTFVPVELQQAVLNRDQGICRYCGQRALSYYIDHLVSQVAGGPTELDNLVTACAYCAERRDGRSLDEAGMVLLMPGEIVG